jgi:ATP-dependent DNA ligase
VGHVKARERDFFKVACAHNLEGTVAKPANRRYHSEGTSTNWIKIKKPNRCECSARAVGGACGSCHRRAIGSLVSAVAYRLSPAAQFSTRLSETEELRSAGTVKTKR